MASDAAATGGVNFPTGASGPPGAASAHSIAVATFGLDLVPAFRRASFGAGASTLVVGFRIFLTPP
jgi:hypothetical protein